MSTPTNPTTIPDEVLEEMADAMLEPSLRTQGKTTSPSGNVVRKQVLIRALRAASTLGWELQERRL
jgi:hypothetical protein